jgi:hypothetical protein
MILFDISSDISYGIKNSRMVRIVNGYVIEMRAVCFKMQATNSLTRTLGNHEKTKDINPLRLD